MKIFHGDIITCDWSGSVFNYLVEDEGEIVFVGDHLPEVYRVNSEYLELGSKALLPAFGDGHIHFSNFSVFNATFDVRSASSIAEIGSIIRQYASRDRQAKLIFGFGHSEHTIAEKRLITRTELDQFIKDRPVVVVCYDGHSAVANSKAIGLLPLKIRDLRGFDLETGQIHNEAFLEAANYICGKIPVPKMLSYMLKGLDTLAAYGVGLIHTTEGVGYPRDLDVGLVRFLARSTQIQIRPYFQTMDINKVLKRKLPRIGGCFDCALDGSFGTKDAAMIEPYAENEKNRGILFYRDEEVNEFVKNANRADLQVQLHCAGDAAVIQAVQAIEAALADYPREDHRHTLIHAPLVPEQTLEKIAKLGIGITLQPEFLVSSLEPVEYLERLLGERVSHIWPLRKMLAMGINISGGSDSPVAPPDPVLGIYGACNHYIPQYSASIAEALCMYTYNIAHTSFDENERGSLETGKNADMIILNKNPLQMEPRDLPELKVEKLFLCGEEYSGGSTIFQALVDGLKSFVSNPLSP